MGTRWGVARGPGSCGGPGRRGGGAAGDEAAGWGGRVGRCGREWRRRMDREWVDRGFVGKSVAKPSLSESRDFSESQRSPFRVTRLRRQVRRQARSSPILVSVSFHGPVSPSAPSLTRTTRRRVAVTDAVRGQFARGESAGRGAAARLPRDPTGGDSAAVYSGLSAELGRQCVTASRDPTGGDSAAPVGSGEGWLSGASGWGSIQLCRH